MSTSFDVIQTDVVTGKRTSLAKSARRALDALRDAGIPHAVIGATALAARGLPRFTADLDVVVAVDDAFAALEALGSAGFEPTTTVDRAAEPEAMYTLADVQGVEVDVLVAAGEPESTVIAEATKTDVFGDLAPVASLEHLILMYLYSNQARHLGDFARIVTETSVDLGWVERYLADVHPEMLEDFRARVRGAKSPPPAPPRPTRRRQRS